MYAKALVRKKAAPVNTRLVNRNVAAPHGRTSMRLEPEVWESLREVCLREGITVEEVLIRVTSHKETYNLTSALRAFLVTYFRDAATEAGHKAAGHGGTELIDGLRMPPGKRRAGRASSNGTS